VKRFNVLNGLSSEEVGLLFILGAGAFLLASTYSGINVALPHIQREFGISLSALKWVSIIGAIMVASLSLCFGRIGDLVGRKRVYKLGMLVYAVGAGLSATATSFPYLMVVRVIMATGLAMASPLAAAIMAATVAPERRGRVLGLFASFQAAGQLGGPTIGGFVLDLFGWRAIFLMNMALGFLLCIAQHFFLRGVEERRHERFDFLGAILLLFGYPSLLIALSYGPRSGWDSTITLFWFGVAAVGLTSFFVRELRYDQPLVRLRFFKSLPFCIAMFTLVIASFVQSPITLFTPLYLQKVLRVDPFTVGLLLLALPISTIIAGPIGGRLADKYNPRVIAAIGVFITLIAVFLYSRLGLTTPLLLVVPPLVLIGVGGGFFRPANQVAVYGSVPANDFGGLSAMISSLASLAGTLGTTVMVAVNETRTKGNDPAELASAQQFTFRTLLPLLAVSVFVSLLGKATARRKETPVLSRTPAS
jgi:EmrB/QacA subfamily drug resistance transporter